MSKTPSQVSVKSVGQESDVSIAGVVDESIEFPTLEKLPHGILRIHLDQVTRLNSMGLRSWILWMKTIPKQMLIEFHGCARGVVDQMSILDGFLPLSARVQSFQLPYRCSQCEHEELVLAVRERDFMEATSDFKEKVLLPETRSCPQCKGTMEWDIIPERYFSFLRRRR